MAEGMSMTLGEPLLFLSVPVNLIGVTFSKGLFRISRKGGGAVLFGTSARKEKTHTPPWKPC